MNRDRTKEDQATLDQITSGTRWVEVEQEERYDAIGFTVLRDRKTGVKVQGFTGDENWTLVGAKATAPKGFRSLLGAVVYVNEGIVHGFMFPRY